MPNGDEELDDDGFETVAESEKYTVFLSELEGETIYNVELGVVTLHLFREEWEELLTLLDDARKALGGSKR